MVFLHHSLTSDSRRVLATTVIFFFELVSVGQGCSIVKLLYFLKRFVYYLFILFLAASGLSCGMRDLH